MDSYQANQSPGVKNQYLFVEKYLFVDQEMLILCWVWGSPDPTNFIFEINVGNIRIGHRTTLQ